MREIMDSISDVRIRKVVAMSSAQVAKSETLVNVVGYYMHYDPVPILMMQPTITMAESFSKNRLAKSIQETPVLRGMISDRRGAGNTILEKVFPGGSIAIVGANSPSSLASRPVQVLLADEVDRYPGHGGNRGRSAFPCVRTAYNLLEQQGSICVYAGEQGHFQDRIRIPAQFTRGMERAVPALRGIAAADVGRGCVRQRQSGHNPVLL